MNVSELLKDLKAERVQGSSAVLSYSNFDHWVNWDDIVEIVEEHEQPELNDNQRIVLEWLKDTVRSGKREPIQALSHLHAYMCLPTHYNKSPYREYFVLGQIEEMQVLEAFAQWGLEQE